ncbi:MAG: phosphoribosylglycinamide formyltransferase [Bacteroidales bacterium]|nr:phosphoribosylglycinamide formyltransferase [Bacteroidales bacterium]
MKRIAIFASGGGTNAEAIARHFKDHPSIHVALVVCNRRVAGVYQRMSPLGVPCKWFGAQEWRPEAQGGLGGKNVLELLRREKIDLVVLAGFLAYIPEALTQGYKDKMVNIHPSLLPLHGGPGMWGHHVHEDVLRCGDRRSGITIHRVSEVVDGGEILFQASCPVMADDTPDSLAERVHHLEYVYYPQVIERLLA